MLSGVLNSDQAIKVNITIMRAFVRLRQLTLTNEELAKKFGELEKFTSTKIKQHDDNFKAVFDAIKRLIKATAPPKQIPPENPQIDTPKRKAGFINADEREKN